MESERKSVFARLGVRPSGGDSSSGSNSSAGSGGSSRSREDLRHRVAHLSGKRSRGGHHHVPIPIPPPPPPPPPTQSRENNNNNQNSSPKHQSITNQQPESMIIRPVEGTKSRKKRLVRRKRMKPPVEVEEKDLDEGEIVDDDEEEEEYEEYEEEMEEEEEEEAEEGELITKKEPIPNLLPEGDNISMSSLSCQSIQNNDNEAGDSQKESTQQQQNDDDDLESKKEVTNSTIIKSKDLQEPEEPASDYSDWSDGEDDELLQANNSQELIKVEGAPGDDNDQEELEEEEEEEMEVVDDSNVAMLINKDNEDDTSDLVDNNNISSSNIEDNRDLEAISDDDLDPLSDDFLFMNDDHKLNPLESPSSEVPITTGNAEVDDLLNKSEGFGLDGNTNTSTATTASTSTSNADTSGDIKVLDILEIDWKSLITETNRKSIPITDDNNQSMESDSTAPVDSGIPVASVTSPSSASHKNAASHAEYRQRNSTIALLNRIGFSHQLAGPELTAFVQRQLSDKLKDQYQPMLHPVPSVHCYLREKREREDSFFTGQHQDSATGGMINPGGAGLPLNGAKIEAFGNLVL